ncbi:NAD(P)H-quinone oxidoreductase subunit L, chloroplastic-like [Coffea arabica]|uniref:NAD(P)H-quinone oxidoreductase subunit L, chloroplastic-like n=1 Tax=Coffea arabica TaxID=13443 RepID=A0A6P6V141_COFAR|nr:NAD(P)H-quinone oxidoreductase subunit L, chloroplastic-like [Coffea arabica]
MSSSLGFQFTKALPPRLPSQSKSPPLLIVCKRKIPPPSKLKAQRSLSTEPIKNIGTAIPSLAIQVGAFFATVAEPALAVTGVNDEEDLITILIQLGICAFIYFIVFPPIIMNWLRIRWYKRGFIEMYFQFMFVFIFFPGLLLWAPFLNFRKFPRDPSMKYPWSTPENPSQIKGASRKYPWATPEDYE